MELIVVWCKESKTQSHEVCDKCPIHRVHIEIPVALVCLDPSKGIAKQLRATLNKDFKKRGLSCDLKPTRAIIFGIRGDSIEM